MDCSSKRGSAVRHRLSCQALSAKDRRAACQDRAVDQKRQSRVSIGRSTRKKTSITFMAVLRKRESVTLRTQDASFNGIWKKAGMPKAIMSDTNTSWKMKPIFAPNCTSKTATTVLIAICIESVMAITSTPKDKSSLHSIWC